MRARITIRRGSSDSKRIDIRFEDEESKLELNLIKSPRSDSEWLISNLDQVEKISRIDRVIESVNRLFSMRGEDVVIVKGNGRDS